MLLLATVGLASATTLEVLKVYQPLSLHGTDVDSKFEGEALQAQIFSRPMVLSGAMPENLVAAIATPHRMPSTFNYEIQECNLLALFQVGLNGAVEDGGSLHVAFDLEKMKAPEGVEVPIRTVLKLAIKALKQTLQDYHHPENKPMKVRVTIEGTTERNASLRDLAAKFAIGG